MTQPPDPPDPLRTFLARTDLSPEQALEALKLAESRRSAGRFSSSPLMAAVVSGLLSGGVATAAITAYVTLTSQEAEQGHEIRSLEQAQRFDTFQKLIDIDRTDLLAESGEGITYQDIRNVLEAERKRRICLAVAVGLVDIEPYMLPGLPAEFTSADFAVNLDSFLNAQFNCSDPGGFVPSSTFSAPSTETLFPAERTSGYLERVLVPNGVNGGLTVAPTDRLVELLGMPRTDLDPTCQPVTNPDLRALMVTEDVGPFRVQMIAPAAASLRRIFERIEAMDPALHSVLGSAGSLCVRTARGTSRPSKHAFGTAIDILVDGVYEGVTGRGDGRTLLGLAIIADFFREEGWYWGIGSAVEEGAHFEVSLETLEAWQADGLLGPAATPD